jgi:(p)ppGpp synthase/HD superfamily hydrolase
MSDLLPNSQDDSATQQESEIYSKGEFLSALFASDRCRNWLDGDKQKVTQALDLAIKAHTWQERDSKQPYMDHIIWVLWDYLHKTSRWPLSPEDVIVAILHDVVEDAPDYSQEIMDRFGHSVFWRVAWLSKPTEEFIQNMIAYKTRCIMGGNGIAWFMSLFQYNATQVTTLCWLLSTHGYLFAHITWLTELQRVDPKNYYFLWKIAFLSEKDFEIKAADRINNLSSLKSVSRKYIQKNITSTKVYIMKAQALGRTDIVSHLVDGLSALEYKLEQLSSEANINPTSSPIVLA